jgi:hypothetical protein
MSEQAQENDHSKIYENNNWPPYSLAAYLAYKSGLPVVARRTSSKMTGFEYCGTDYDDYVIELPAPEKWLDRIKHRQFEPILLATMSTKDRYIDGEPSVIDVTWVVPGIWEEDKFRVRENRCHLKQMEAAADKWKIVEKLVAKVNSRVPQRGSLDRN